MRTMTQITDATLDEPCDEDHVLLAVVRPRVEPAVHRLDGEPGLVEEAKPLGHGEPVQVERRLPAVAVADREPEGSGALVPIRALEDAGLALEPEPVRLLDVLPARAEDVEDEAPVR